MKHIKLFLLFVCIIVSQLGFAQGIDATKLDSYFEALEAGNKFHGSIAVSQDGNVLYAKTIGFADVEKKMKHTATSTYRIGSVSKTFTSVLCFKAIEENKLSLSQTIENYFPSIKNANKITINHLLYHQSGIHNFTDDESYLSWYTKPKTEQELVAIISKGGSDFKPGRKAEYSNSNFVLLSYILEKTFNKSYSDLLEEYIVKPIGLVNTHITNQPGDVECKSYSYSGDWIAEATTDASIPMGAGGITSTPNDLNSFADALFNEKIISRQSVDQMKAIQSGYGRGLFQMPFYDKPGFGHAGDIDGFSSILSYFPNDKIAFALTSNGSNYNNNDIAIAVLSAVYNKAFEIPDFTELKLTSNDLDRYLGIYLSKQISLKITISKNDKTLFAQATGQPLLPLEPIAKDKFRQDKIGAVLEFNASDKTMILKQDDSEILFKMNEGDTTKKIE